MQFIFSPQTATIPTFVQARNKIKSEAFEQPFYQTIPSGTPDKSYKGYQLLAHDGSDINIPLYISYKTIDIQKSK